MERGADGAMTGYAFPELLIDVVKLSKAGKRDAAHDLFDAHLPLIRYGAAARRGIGGAEICAAKARRDRLQRATHAGLEHHCRREGRGGVSALARRAGRQARQPASAIKCCGVDQMAEAVNPRPGSTILLLRDSAATKGADGKSRDEIEVFMMVRHYEIDFNSGALVFPGGSGRCGRSGDHRKTRALFRR